MAVIGILAGATFALALTLLGVFFTAKSELADRLSNWAFLAFGILLVPVILEIQRRYVDHTGLTWLATVAGLAASAVIIVSSALLVTGRVSFARVSIPETAAFAIFAVWAAAASVLILAFGGLPVGLGWLGLTAVLVGLGAIAWVARDPAMLRGQRAPTGTEMVSGVAPFIALAAWLIWLGASL